MHRRTRKKLLIGTTTLVVVIWVAAISGVSSRTGSDDQAPVKLDKATTMSTAEAVSGGGVAAGVPDLSDVAAATGGDASTSAKASKNG